MAVDDSSNSLLRGMICLSLALGLEEDRMRYGVPEAVNRLRAALIENELWLPDDNELLVGILTGKVSSEQAAEAICSFRRMGLPGGQ